MSKTRMRGEKTHLAHQNHQNPVQPRASDVQVRLNFSNLEILTLDFEATLSFSSQFDCSFDCSDWTHFFSDKN